MAEILYGHEAKYKYLEDLLSTDNFPNTLLLEGDRGVGKQTLVYNFLASWLAKQKNPQFIGFRDSVHMTQSLVDSDLYFYDPLGKTLSIDQVREIAKIALRPPMKRSWKWIVIDDVEMMSVEAENSILKLLEDAPLKSKFILISNNSDKLLPTIRGRAFTLTLPSFTEEQVRSYLLQRGLDGADSLLYASFSEGSIGTALSYWQDPSFKLLFRGVVSFFEDCHTLPLHTFWKYQQQLVDDYEPRQILNVLSKVLSDVWLMKQGVAVNNAYYRKDKLEQFFTTTTQKDMVYLSSRLKSISSVTASINFGVQIKSMFMDIREK